MPEQTVIEAVRDSMRAEMRRDESVILLGEDDPASNAEEHHQVA